MLTASLGAVSFGNLLEVGSYIFLQFLQSLTGPLVPSEAVAAGARVLGMDIFSVAVLGAIGATVGDSINYFVAKQAGRPILSRLNPRFVLKVETRLKRHGLPMLVLVSMVPFGLSEFVSYFAGLFNVDVKFFISMTYVGALVRLFITASLLVELFV